MDKYLEYAYLLVQNCTNVCIAFNAKLQLITGHSTIFRQNVCIIKQTVKPEKVTTMHNTNRYNFEN